MNQKNIYYLSHVLPILVILFCGWGIIYYLFKADSLSFLDKIDINKNFGNSFSFLNLGVNIEKKDNDNKVIKNDFEELSTSTIQTSEYFIDPRVTPWLDFRIKDLPLTGEPQVFSFYKKEDNALTAKEALFYVSYGGRVENGEDVEISLAKKTNEFEEFVKNEGFMVKKYVFPENNFTYIYYFTGEDYVAVNIRKFYINDDKEVATLNYQNKLTISEMNKYEPKENKEGRRKMGEEDMKNLFFILSTIHDPQYIQSFLDLKVKKDNKREKIDGEYYYLYF